jgi:glycosyltransferase involved in cell wall biosynthesis
MRVEVFTGQPGYAFLKNSAPQVETFPNFTVRRSRLSRLWPQRILGKLVNGLLFCFQASLHLLKTARQFDVVMLTTEPPYLTILGYLICRSLKVPYICLLYDLYPDVAVRLKVVKSHHWLVRLWDWLNCQAWKNARAVIVLSPTMKKQLLTKCPDIASQIHVIHSWANPQWIVPIAKPFNWFAHQHGLVHPFTVLYSGNMGRCHDMDTILEAAQYLRHEPIQFIFIGSGAKQQTCVDRAAALGLRNCQFLPYQDKQKLPYSLTACDLALVSLSAGMEGLTAPSKLYGIMAAGRPVAAICEPCSYLRQIVETASCGQAINNGDGIGLADFICCLMANPQLGQQMGQAGRHFLLSHFTLDTIGKQYFNILQTTAAGQTVHLSTRSATSPVNVKV